MGKKMNVAASVTGAGTTASTAGTIANNSYDYETSLVQPLSSGGDSISTSDSQKSSSSETLLDAFRKNFQFGNTSDSIIDGGIDVNSINSANTSLNQFNLIGTAGSDGLLDTYKDGDHAHVKSILKITTSRVEYKGGKWNGSLFWYWSFKYKNQGFVTFNVAETSETEKKLNLTGGFYIIGKSNNNNWTIKHKKEVDKSKKKTLDKNNFDNYFPKPYWYTKKGGFDKYYWSNWKFIKASWDLDNICTNTGNTNKCWK